MTVRVSLPAGSEDIIADHANRWRAGQVLERLWNKDPTVWADPPIPETADRLGWLDAPRSSRTLLPAIESLHQQAVHEGITDIVLCGMGGSSLAPEVLSSTLPHDGSSPRLTVIDSTHPDAVSGVASATDAESTWYIIASKSGGTIETMSLFRYFWSRAVDQLSDPGSHFIAITDPGSSLETLAGERGFRTTVLADPDVGGRYSALTAFGLVPTGLIGGDVSRLLVGAEHAASMCGPTVPLEDNPGFGIGVIFAVRASSGSDKAQFICTPPVETIGMWIEQLVAESTGKNGLGIVPIDGPPRLADDTDTTVVSVGGLPVSDVAIALDLDDPYDVGGVMFILEFATSVAGRSLGINPFNQPDVQVAKKLAVAAMDSGLGSDGAPPFGLSDPQWIVSLQHALHRTTPSYVSVEAYVPQTADSTARLTELRRTLTEGAGAHVTVGFGPRFLHSTGQLHKGGPPGGIHLQIIADTNDPLDIPEVGYTFNELIAAQAAGDRAALADRNRTVIAVNVGADCDTGLASMVKQVRQAADERGLAAGSST